MKKKGKYKAVLLEVGEIEMIIDALCFLRTHAKKSKGELHELENDLRMVLKGTL